MLLWFLVTRFDKTFQLCQKAKRGVHFLKKVKKTSTIFGTTIVISAVQNLIPSKAFTLKNLW